MAVSSTSKLRESRNLVIPQSVHKEIKRAAVDLDKTVGQVATEAAREWLERHSEDKVPQPVNKEDCG